MTAEHVTEMRGWLADVFGDDLWLDSPSAEVLAVIELHYVDGVAGFVRDQLDAL